MRPSWACFAFWRLVTTLSGSSVNSSPKRCSSIQGPGPSSGWTQSQSVWRSPSSGTRLRRSSHSRMIVSAFKGLLEGSEGVLGEVADVAVVVGGGHREPLGDDVRLDGGLV